MRPWHSRFRVQGTGKESRMTKSMTKHQKLRLLTLSLVCGDSLGSTSEFCEQCDVPRIYLRQKDKGWPFKRVGQGHFNWKPGEPTDDSAMAMCIVRSFMAKAKFDPADIATHFVDWLDSSPPDVGTAACFEILHRHTRHRLF